MIVPICAGLKSEVISGLPGPRGNIVSLLCGSSNQRSVVTCKGDFPFPFQVQNDLYFEQEVKWQYAGD